MRRTIPAILVLTVALFGCKVKELADKARAEKALDKRSTVSLMKEVANDKYDPPTDGKLTEAQIQMYLKVRTHEKEIAQIAMKKADEHFKKGDAAKNSLAGVMESFKGMSAAAEYATADIRAAKDLGYNTQEYLWVKGQVMAASMAAFSEGVTNAMSAQMEASYRQTKKSYDEAKDAQSKEAYRQMLESYGQTVKEGKEITAKANEDPALVYNRQLLKKYDTELAAFTTEMSKYESKDGEAKNAMDELQKKMNKAVEDAKKQP